VQTISIPVIQGFIFKETNRIIRIEASSNYSRIYCTDEHLPITVAKVLAWFVQKLPQQDFIRTHRTHLINKQFIRRTQGNEMILQNGDIVSISRRRRTEVKRIA
jgi:two-component system LytT family response regulator